MAKKKKRRYSASKKAASRSTAPETSRAVSPEATAAVAAEEPTPNRSDEGDFRSEYRYVLSDLKRIGILAAAMFGALIGLAVILP